MNEAIKMQLSAFVDGELPENEQELLLRRLSQDASLRKQVAEYLAIGHAMRGEMQIGGINGVRERVARALDEKPLQDIHVEEPLQSHRLVRPLAGFAIAATVALAAVFGLQQLTSVDVENPATADIVAESAGFPTQPAADNLLRQYELMHSALASDNGANNIRARLTSLEMLQENAEETTATPDDESIESETGDSKSE